MHRPGKTLGAICSTLALGVIAASQSGGCLAGGPPIDPITNQGGDGIGGGGDGASTSTGTVDPPPTEAHQVIGATPSHGSFEGGARVVVRGNGFASDVRVWFGETEATDVVPVDATRVQVTAPPGTRGPVDVSAQNGDDVSTLRSLAGGYVYDALYADPSSGPVAGGTEISIVGQGTAWDASTQAFIDEKPCASLTVVSGTELLCVTPKGTPGAKVVRVEGGDETIDVIDGYTYEDSSDGFKGGLSGDPIDGSVRVLVYDNITGDPIPGAYAILGTDITESLIQQVDDTGVTTFDSPLIDGPVTVTVAGICHSPITFVDVPVDTVTVYLDPVLAPSCASGGDPPGVGGQVGATGTVEGEIVFPSIGEFQRGPFLVPEPIGDEKAVAYVFASNSQPLAAFILPPAINAITENTPGTLGYGFNILSLPGNRTYYALAGLEDRSQNPARFTAYSMGVVRGVPVIDGGTTSEVYISMQPLDLALTIDPTPPAPGTNGPDRFAVAASIRLGSDGFAILPGGQQAPLLPLSGDVEFVGLPLLADAFEGSTYYVSSRAVTGPSLGAPLSVVSSQQTTTTAFPIVVNGFVGMPKVITPPMNAAWNGRFFVAEYGPGEPPDLTVYDVISGNGLMHWTVAVAGADNAIEIPDLRELPGGVALPSGPITVSVTGGKIEGFDYAKLRMRQLRPFGMKAYSQDFVEAHLP